MSLQHSWIRSFLWVGVTLVLIPPAAADNWPNWRGPTDSGAAADGEYPLDWGRNKNVTWKLSLPGRAGSTPAVWKDRIYLTCEDGQQNLVMCVNRDGQARWKTHVGRVRAGKHKKGSGCNPSPTTDGERVIVYFKSGDLAALNADGNVVWSHNLQQRFGDDTLWWDLGTSPVLAGESVIVACMQSGSSYIAAFHTTDGKLLWKQDRNLTAPDEANQSYTTPAVTRDVEQNLLIVAGADHVTAHATETGREVWRVGGLNPEQNRFSRSIASPVIFGRRVFVPYSRGATLTAIELGGRGDVTGSHVTWAKDGLQVDVPTPAIHGDTIYVCSDRGEVQAIQTDDGKSVWKRELPRSRSNFSSSPIVTSTHIYLTREDGTTFVVELDAPHDIVAQNSLEEMTVATPVLVDGRILLQTFENLYCIQNEA